MKKNTSFIDNTKKDQHFLDKSYKSDINENFEQYNYTTGNIDESS